MSGHPIPGPPPGPSAAAPRAVTPPTDDSTGDPQIDAALDRLRGTDAADLDAQIAAGSEVHDLLRQRLADQA